MWHKIRQHTIRLDFLVTILFLIITIVFSVIFQNYYYSKKTMLNTSESFVVKESTALLSELIERFYDAREALVILSNLTDEEWPHLQDVPPDLLRAFIAAVKYAPPKYASTIFRMSFATVNGYLFNIGLAVNNEVAKKNPGFLKDAEVAIDILQKNANSSYLNTFLLDKGLNLVYSQEGVQGDYDPRQRNWYVETKEKGELYWTAIYLFYPENKPGFTVAMPIKDAQNNFKGVAAVDLTIDSLSYLLAHQKTTANSKSYVIDEREQVIASSEAINNFIYEGTSVRIIKAEEIKDQILRQATELYHFYGETNNVIYFKVASVDYAALVTPFPRDFSQDWKLLTVYPLEDFIRPIKNDQRKTFFISLWIVAASSIAVFLLARRISKPLITLTNEAEKIKNLEWGEPVQIKTTIQELQVLAKAINSMKNSLNSFARYMPKTVVAKLISRKQPIQIGGTEKELTILFSDICNFTTISENLSANQLASYLSDYFDGLSTIIMKQDGTIDKYIGDSIMAFWGAPLKDRNQAANACYAALLCQKRLNELNVLWHQQKRPTMKTRMGIHIGTVVVGNMGSSERMNYTAIGDNVNVASRLEDINKVYGTQIIISEPVYDKIKHKFLCRPLDRVILKGKAVAITIYELVAQMEGNDSLLPTEEQMSFCQHFEKGYHLYFSMRWSEALANFEYINEHIRLNDLSTYLYIERCKHFLQNPPDKDWDGTFQFHEK